MARRDVAFFAGSTIAVDAAGDAAMKRGITRRVLSDLVKFSGDAEAYGKFWDNFGKRRRYFPRAAVGVSPKRRRKQRLK